MIRTYKVKVAATTANIGPGFDTLGIALNLFNSFSFTEIEGLELVGFERSFTNENNLVYSSMLRAFEKLDFQPRGVRIEADIEIPVEKGLGSSASCIVAGLVAANLIMGSPLGVDELLELAVEIEGHPDNVVPALLGGLVISLMDDGLVYSRHELNSELSFIALVPNFSLSTSKARAVLPTSVSHKDAVENVSRVTLLMSALLGGNYELLRHGLKDRLHEPYRGELIADFEMIKNKAMDLGALGSYLSGAGPTIMCLYRGDSSIFAGEMKDFLGDLSSNWELLSLLPSNQGVVLD